jgi:hypothetical protein
MGNGVFRRVLEEEDACAVIEQVSDRRWDGWIEYHGKRVVVVVEDAWVGH